MLVTEKGQVTIPKHIRTAAGVVPGTEVSFSLDGGKIVITPVAGSVKNDRRAQLVAAAAKVRSSMRPEFAHLGAQEIMDFLRGEGAVPVGTAARAAAAAPTAAAAVTKVAAPAARGATPRAAGRGRR